MTVYRRGEGATSEVEVPALSESLLGQGQIGAVRRITLSRGEGKEPWHFAYKKFDRPDPDRGIKAVDINSILISLPHGREYALPTLRYAHEGLFMTDLSEGGRNLVVSTNDNPTATMNEAQRINKDNPHFISNFITNTNIGGDRGSWERDFDHRAELIAEETASAGIKLAGDSIFVVIYPDGEYRLRIVDLDNVHHNPNLPAYELKENNIKAIQDSKPLMLRLWAALLRETKK